MSVESDLYAALAGHAGLAALVGERIYPALAPQGVGKPYVVTTRVSSEPQVCLDGFTGALERVRVQADCYAADFATARAVAAQARAAIQAQTGSNNLRGVCTNETDFFEDDTRLYRRMVEFSIFHRS